MVKWQHTGQEEDEDFMLRLSGCIWLVSNMCLGHILILEQYKFSACGLANCQFSQVGPQHYFVYIWVDCLRLHSEYMAGGKLLVLQMVQMGLEVQVSRSFLMRGNTQ